MKFVTHNQQKIKTGGTFLVDHIECSYQSLVDIFGEPHKGDEYKTDACWDIEFEDGTVASIYNYKTGKNYLEEEGLPVEEITHWHVAGYNRKAIDNLCLIGNIKPAISFKEEMLKLFKE